MTLTERDRRALLLLAVAAIGSLLYVWSQRTPAAEEAEAIGTDPQSVQAAEMRLQRARRMAASVPKRREALKVVQADLVKREAGLVQADTAAQALAQVLQIARRVAKAQNMDLRPVDTGRIEPLGEDYGEAKIGVSTECHIEELVNFLADLTAQRELVSSYGLQVSHLPARQKEKVFLVTMTLSAVVPKRLVPAKRSGLL